MMTRMHPDDMAALIEGVAERVISRLGLPVVTVIPTLPVDPAQHAINLAKAGKIEESKQFLRNLSKSTSKRRSSHA